VTSSPEQKGETNAEVLPQAPLLALRSPSHHDDAAQRGRAAAPLSRESGIGERRLLVALAQRCVETAPPEMRPTYERWTQAYREGRRVKVGTYTATLLEPVPDEMVRAVDEAFEEGDNS